jgi:DNA polymerase III subunit epsilon
MSVALWGVVLATAVVQAALLTAAVLGIWTEVGYEQRAALSALWATHAGVGIILCAALVFVPVIAIMLVFRWYVAPMSALTDGVQMIALSNPAHRPMAKGPPELRALIDAVSLLADRYQALMSDLHDRVRDAAEGVKEERDTLAALMSKLTQGVVVCNLEGRVLLYNQQAQSLLEGPKQGTGAGDWIGLGRSIYSILDEGPIRHALMTLVRARQRGETLVLVPFVASRPGGQLLNVHLVPISGENRLWHGYILTFEDVTGRLSKETRKAKTLQALIERQRSAVTGIRAGIETILGFPEMEPAERARFHALIHEEVVKLSTRFEGLEDQLSEDVGARSLFQDALASDLLGAIERHVRDVVGIGLDVSVPLEPVRLRVDSYAIARCLIFLIRQLQQACRAEDISLTVRTGSTLVTLLIGWSGARLYAEALRSWGERNVFEEIGGANMTLFEVIEQHSGGIWPQTPGPDGRPKLRLLLPLSDVPPETLDAAPGDTSFRQDFDFRLSARPARATDPATAKLTDLIYTVIDTETTGLNPEGGDEIISIAAVRIVNGRVLRREIFDQLVNPRRYIPQESQAVHGITSGMLRGAPGIEEVLPRLARFVEDTVIVGHNIAFDLRFFARKEEEVGVRFTNPLLDTFFLEGIVHPKQADRRLDAIAARLGINVTGRHTALGDALITAAVFVALIPGLAEHGIVTLKQAADACAADLEVARSGA